MPLVRYQITESNAPANTKEAPQSLGEMRYGEKGTILRLEGPEDLTRRLLEMGFMEGAPVELAHEAPFGKDPIAVRVRGALLALRRSSAAHVLVRKDKPR